MADLLESLRIRNTSPLYSQSMDYWRAIIRPLAGDAFIADKGWINTTGQTP